LTSVEGGWKIKRAAKKSQEEEIFQVVDKNIRYTTQIMGGRGRVT
jgi:hypothetical protein